MVIEPGGMDPGYLGVDEFRMAGVDGLDVFEDRHLDESPPRVDLDVQLEPRPPNTWQGTIGVGSDTGPRAQLGWNRHLVSRRGDSFSLLTGWQDHNDEYFIRANYRIPRKVQSRQFWVADALLKRENETVKLRNQSDDETLFTLGDADISDDSLRRDEEYVQLEVQHHEYESRLGELAGGDHQIQLAIHGDALEQEAVIDVFPAAHVQGVGDTAAPNITSTSNETA